MESSKKEIKKVFDLIIENLKEQELIIEEDNLLTLTSKGKEQAKIFVEKNPDMFMLLLMSFQSNGESIKKYE